MRDNPDPGRVLRACVADHDWSAPPAGLERLVAGRRLGRVVEASRYHGVDNAVYLSLRSISEADPAAVGELDRRYRLAVGRHLRTLADLQVLGGVMDRAGVPWIVFKGPVLTEVVYDRPDLRSYGDLDVLVEPGSFASAVEAMEASGFPLLDRNWELILREQRGQLHLVLPFGTVADVHWHLLNRAAVRRSMSVPVHDVFARARAVRLGDVCVRTLDAVDTVVHLCVHAALAGGHRLVWLKDIDRAVARLGGQWPELTRRAGEWHATLAVGAMLERARRALGCEVPVEVLQELVPSSVRRGMNMSVDRVWPPERSRSARSPSALWGQTLRPSSSSAAVFLSRLRARTAPAPRRHDEGVGTRHRPSWPVLRSSGDAATRAAFFLGVAGQGVEDSG